MSITNRIGSTNLTTDTIAFADLGTGFVPLPTAAQVTNNFVALNGLTFTVPASGRFSLRISNLRAAVNQLGATAFGPLPLQAQIVFAGPLLLNQSVVTVANSQPGLLASTSDRGAITCVGSPVPATISMSSLFAAGTFFATTRVTEGFASAFQPRGAGEDSGTRFLLQFSGLPAGTRLFVPDLVAGSSAAVPTAGGDMGVPQSGGVYVPGSGTLLLARVPNADNSGAGGAAAVPTGSSAITLDSASEVTLSSTGSAYVVYEVVDAQASGKETAQIPVFVGLPNASGRATAQETVTLAPLSTVQIASATAPVPRFANVPPAPDCTALGDCGANYFPKLAVDAPPIQFTAVANAAAVKELPGYIRVLNNGGGFMPWTVTIQYVNGSGWAFLDYTSGVNNASVRVTANPKGLAPGTYRANLIFDAGAAAGMATVPVTLIVSPAPTPPTSSGTGATSGSGTSSGAGTGTSTTTTPPAPAAPAVTVSQIVNAATFDPTPLVAGSLGTVMGSNLAGKSVSVTFDGVNADLLYTGANQINLLVPAALRGKNSSTMVVTVDGVSSAPQTVILAPAWPAIFAHGVLNQDNSVNAPDAAAGSGSILQIYATGIPDGATVSVQIGDRKELVPLYAGPAPTVPGVQQVNVAVPDTPGASTTPLVICASSGSQQFCSAGYVLAVQ